MSTSQLISAPQELTSSAHMNSNGQNGASSSAKNPLAGLVPRKVTADQAKKIMVSVLCKYMVGLRRGGGVRTLEQLAQCPVLLS